VTGGHTLTLTGLTLTHGSLLGNGGGIDNLGGTVSVTNSRITDNVATGSIANDQGFGGGVFNTDVGSGPGILTLTSTLVSGNRASNGGGVSSISFQATTQATLTNTIVENNVATSGGAGGVQNCGSLTTSGSSIRNNTAVQGGGLTNRGNPPSGPSGTARLISSPVTGNHATAGHGGGLSNGGTLTLISSPVTSNTAAGPGGGIFNAPPGTVSLIASAVTGNQPDQCSGTTC
jgi:hypothetical protein